MSSWWLGCGDWCSGYSVEAYRRARPCPGADPSGSSRRPGVPGKASEGVQPVRLGRIFCAGLASGPRGRLSRCQRYITERVTGGFSDRSGRICLSPLLVFIGSLAAAKRQALLEYGALVGKHGRLVRRRWILGKLDEDALLQAPEIGPVADTLTLYEAVKKMRVVPIGKSAIMGVALPALIPMLVLFSIQVPIKDLLMKLLGILV